eukprot:337069-Prymnesium_polylepis.1
MAALSSSRARALACRTSQALSGCRASSAAPSWHLQTSMQITRYRNIRFARAVQPAGGVSSRSLLVRRAQVDFFLSVSPEGVVAHERAAANARQAAERAAKERDLAQAAAQLQWDQSSDDVNLGAPPSRLSRALGDREEDDQSLPTGEANSAGDGDARERTWPERQLQLW